MPRGEIAVAITTHNYGFIRPADSPDDVFFHAAECPRGVFPTLQEGELVDYDVRQTPKRMRAYNVRVVEEG